MTTQRLHSNLAPIDVLTREEMEQLLDTNFDRELRERFRGLDIARVPVSPITATTATVNLFTGNDQTPWGPEQGDCWMLRRVNVKSNVFADTAKWLLFRGSTPSDLANSYTSRWLLETFTAAGAGQPVGMGYYFSTKSVYVNPGEQIYALVTGATIGNQYIFDAEAIRCPAEMKGKIL